MQGTATLSLDHSGKVGLRVECPDQPTHLAVFDSIDHAIKCLSGPGWTKQLGEQAVGRFTENLSRIKAERS